MGFNYLYSKYFLDGECWLMTVHGSNISFQTYSSSRFAEQSTLSGRPDDTMMSSTSRLHNYHTRSHFSSTVNVLAPNVLDRGWAGPGNANLSSASGGNQQIMAGFPGGSEVMSLFARAYMEFQQAFTRYAPWGSAHPRPASEPKPGPKAVLAACPAPVLEPSPKPEPRPAQHFPGDTRYGFNSNTGNTQTSLVSTYDRPWFSVKDAGGNDTLDFSGFKQHQVINLGAGTYSSVGGMANNVYISRESKIENAVGGAGNDRIIGNSSDNVLLGGEGADTLSGGGGSNVFKYNAAADSTYENADLLTDFKTGWDKIDLCGMANAAGVRLNLVHSFTGRPGDTIIKYNANSGRYFMAVDMSGNRHSDFLIKSTRPFGPEDVIGLS